MPEMTPHIGLKKPLATETADISVINDNMDMIDLALGDLSTVPTTAKDAAGAIAELHSEIEAIDVNIPDATLTTKGKVQLSSATNSTAEDRAATPKAVKTAYDLATSANNAGSAASIHAARTDNPHATTKAQVGLGNVDNVKQLPISGGQMTGSLVTSASPGAIGDTTANKGGIFITGAGGPGDAAFQTFHRPGSYAAYFGLDTDNRWKVGGWSAGAVAHELWHDGRLRINAGRLEFFDGAAWKGVGDELSQYPNMKVVTGPNINALTTVVNVTGKKGYLDRALMVMAGNTGGNQMVVTIDGVVVFNTTFVGVNSGFTVVGINTNGQTALRVIGGVSTYAGGAATVVGYPYSGTDAAICPLPGKLFFNNSLKIEIKSGSNPGHVHECGFATE